MIPGVGSSSEHFAAVAQMLTNDGHEIEVLDRPGQGQRLGIERPDLHLEDTIDWLCRIIGDSDVHLIGHSIGCLVVAGCAVRLPHQTKSLGLYEPFATWDSNRNFAYGIRSEDISNMLTEFIYGRYENAFKVFSDWLLGEGTWDSMSRSSRDAILASRPGVWCDIIGVGMFLDANLYAISDIQVPTVVGTSPDSPEEIRDIATKWLDMIKGSSLFEIPGGHLPFVLNPSGFAQFVQTVRTL